MADLKHRLISWARPEDFEIKARDIRRGASFFEPMNWPKRMEFVTEIAKLIAQLPCDATSIAVRKDTLTEYIETDIHLYRIALTKLLDELQESLRGSNDYGALRFDARPDLHSNVQNRRLLDVYWQWNESERGEGQFIEPPWFGFSAFYVGI